MPADSEHERSEQVLIAARDRLSAEAAVTDAGAPWSYRVAGVASAWPAVEVYEAGSLLDVVSATRLTARVLRGARALRVGRGDRALAWGRVPIRGDLPVVEFSRGRFRAVAERVTPVLVTNWCWVATADDRYDTVTVRSAGLVVSRRLRVSRSCR